MSLENLPPMSPSHSHRRQSQFFNGKTDPKTQTYPTPRFGCLFRFGTFDLSFVVLILLGFALIEYPECRSQTSKSQFHALSLSRPVSFYLHGGVHACASHERNPSPTN
jgi:hypothetical protein